MLFAQLKQQLNEKVFQVLSIFGEDAYLRQKSVQFVTESLKLQMPDLNVTVFSESSDLKLVLESCAVFPFFDEHRLVVLKDFVFNTNEKEVLLKRYVSNPCEQCCFLIVNEKEDSFVKTLKLENVDCSKLDSTSLIKWIVAFCAKSDRKISSTNATILMNFCLKDMMKISQEVKKLCLFCESEIEEKDIVSMVKQDSEFLVYELANAIATKNGQRALEIAKFFNESGEKPVLLLASVCSTFRRLFFALISSSNLKDLANYLNCKEFAVVKARETAQNFKPMQLKKAYGLCLKTEEEIKFGKTNATSAFNTLVLALLNI